MIVEEAAAAWVAKKSEDAAAKISRVDALVVAARLVVADLLAPLDAAVLTVAASDLGSGLVVLTDGVMSLGVVDGRVFLVADDGGWSQVAGPLDSLALLGRWLARQPAPVAVRIGRA